MQGRKTALVVLLTDQEQQQLSQWVRSTTMPVGLVKRAQAVLLVAQGMPLKHTATKVGLTERHVRAWVTRFISERIAGLKDRPGRGRKPSFSPQAAIHAVKIACELPQTAGRSLSVWTCQEIARQLMAAAITPSISRESVRKILTSHRLKPWRYRMWLSSKVPRDAAFRAKVERLCELYTRALADNERVICTDEITSLQPRPRLSPTLPALPELPVRVEHEYQRAGALHLLTAFDTRTGKVWGIPAERKRQVEFLQLLALLDAQIPESVTVIYLVWDNVPMHTGKKIQEGLASHPRFVFVHPPVHCSWRNQVEQWFSILRRKRLKVVDFADKTDLAAKLTAFIREWNERAHAFNWTTKSFEKILAKCEQAVPIAA